MKVKEQDISESVVEILKVRKEYFEKMIQAKCENDEDKKSFYIRLIITSDSCLNGFLRIAKSNNELLYKFLLNTINSQVQDLSQYVKECGVNNYTPAYKVGDCHAS